MFKKVKELRENNENGFTLTELLVVILIIGILAAIAIPVFLNQRKVAVDASVESDVRTVALEIETWAISNKGAVVPNQTVTYQTPAESNASGNSGAGQLAFIGANISSAIISAAAADGAKVSQGTTVLVKGTVNPGEFCLYGVNTNGNASAKDAGIVRDSSGEACEYDGTPETIPTDVAALIAGAETGADAGTGGVEDGALEGDLVITINGTMSDVDDGPFNETYVLKFNDNKVTNTVEYTIDFSVPDSGNGVLYFGGDAAGVQTSFTANSEGKASGSFTYDDANTFIQYAQGTWSSTGGDNFQLYGGQ